MIILIWDDPDMACVFSWFARPSGRPDTNWESRMNNYRWRTVDIVVTAVIAVAFGVIFWAWNLLWFTGVGAAVSWFPPLGAVVTGMWFVPAVLAPMIVRKPGAGFFAELVAAQISFMMGSAWGWTVLLYGVVQGLAGEAGFAAFRYR